MSFLHFAMGHKIRRKNHPGHATIIKRPVVNGTDGTVVVVRRRIWMLWNDFWGFVLGEMKLQPDDERQEFDGRWVPATEAPLNARKPAQ